jgi:hypothetical protein
MGLISGHHTPSGAPSLSYQGASQRSWSQMVRGRVTEVTEVTKVTGALYRAFNGYPLTLSRVRRSPSVIGHPLIHHFAFFVRVPRWQPSFSNIAVIRFCSLRPKCLFSRDNAWSAT